jgi:RNA polymerase-binding transcription factor DksA
MAAKKTAPKAAPKKAAPKVSATKAAPAKPAKKAAPAKKPAPAAKPAAKKVVAKPVPAKKPAPKAAPKPAPKAAPSKAAPAKKAEPAKKPAPVAKAAPAKPVAAAKPAPAPAKPVVKAAPVKPAPAPAPVAATNGNHAAPSASVSHSASFVDKQKQRLLDLRDELVDAMTGTTRDTIRNAPEGSEASGSGMHQGDAGSDAYDRDFALSVLAKEQDALYEIEQALQRIKKGAYGVCEMSGKKIPQARLEAIPFARLTVECQAQWEKEYGNRRYRPSNEVGFSGGNYVEDEDSETVSLDEDDD